MVPSGWIERVTMVGLPRPIDCLPLSFGGGVIETLDGIADGHYKGWIFNGRLFPYLLIDTRLSVARAVAQKNEME